MLKWLAPITHASFMLCICISVSRYDTEEAYVSPDIVLQCFRGRKNLNRRLDGGWGGGLA